jgi:hypothetical protein
LPDLPDSTRASDHSGEDVLVARNVVEHILDGSQGSTDDHLLKYSHVSVIGRGGQASDPERGTIDGLRSIAGHCRNTSSTQLL